MYFVSYPFILSSIIAIDISLPLAMTKLPPSPTFISTHKVFPVFFPKKQLQIDKSNFFWPSGMSVHKDEVKPAQRS